MQMELIKKFENHWRSVYKETICKDAHKTTKKNTKASKNKELKKVTGQRKTCLRKKGFCTAI